ncbi:acyl-coenzyme A diphosphatase NUDT19-like [Danaus plexippus]|uniref:acyl-coenzyme A diphosphatase NUDT19-like n=1 Tax=Danaus plexippus TaxID=13037 RepID=UPI002AB04EEB|nr:acyl-coenzyme A diphosphatase NUDT19-like [Danaus plexippus]
MKRAIGKCWRDSASLIVIAKRNVDVSSSGNAGDCNYDILLQTRTHSASFSNSVVFPGGVCEEADASDHWLHLLSSFGYNHRDFETLHKASAPVTPILANNPVKRHIALRITAIRETFEELGLLICSSRHKNNKSDSWSQFVCGVDVKYWQARLNKDPLDFLVLCKEHNCYPDIFGLHYWSNWLSPTHLPRRFDTAFFLAALENKPSDIKANSEVVKVEWSTPLDTLERNKNRQLILYPPQAYELNRFSYFKDIDKLKDFAKEKSCEGNDLIFPTAIQAADGIAHLLPGDYLYPSNVDLNIETVIEEAKTLEELRDTNQTLHRFETSKRGTFVVTQNYKPSNHINMGDQVKPLNASIHMKV